MMRRATNSVVPEATVVSINVRQRGLILSPIARTVASRAAILASPERMFPNSCFVCNRHCTSTTTQSASVRQSLSNVTVSVFFSLTHRARRPICWPQTPPPRKRSYQRQVAKCELHLR